MKHVLLVLLLCLSYTFINSQNIPVSISYAQNEVSVIHNNKLIGINPSSLNVNFDLPGYIVFFKKGYFSHKIEIDVDKPFNQVNINLTNKQINTKLDVSYKFSTDTLAVSKIVTNFTHSEIKEELDQNFIKNNCFIGKNSELFPNAENEISDSRYKIAIEIIDQNQVRGIYKAPRFMFGYIKIRWALLDDKSNKVVFFKETEGMHFVKILKRRGLVASKVMKQVIKEAIKEAQLKLLTNEEFIKLLTKA